VIIVKRRFTDNWVFLHMLIPTSFKNCIAFIGCLVNGSMSVRGSAFFMARSLKGTDSFAQYLVTSQHLLNGIREDSDDQVVRVKVNMKDNPAKWIPTDIDEWKLHPTNPPNIDVAVLPIYRLGDWENAHFLGFDESISKDEYSLREDIGLGDEVNIVGLFTSDHGIAKVSPIVRCGTIARMPEGNIRIQISKNSYGLTSGYLVETHSTGGLSGSPVFLNVRDVYVKENGEVKYRELFYLLGIMYGHWKLYVEEEESKDLLDELRDVIDKINTGISLVIPASRIYEIFERDDLVKDREEMIEELSIEKMPVPDAATPELTRDEFMTNLKKASRPEEAPPDEGTSET